MRIGGLQKTSMLDFPGKVSAILFTQGCNFRCPYCHNPDLVLQKQQPLAVNDVIEFLKRRKKVLDGVVITGGEPTLHEDLFAFCVTLQDIGYEIKLDTNGSRPNILQKLIESNLLSYVAMDIKSNPEEYPETICHDAISKEVVRSIVLLEESSVEHEFRIPCVAPFIDMTSFEILCGYISHAPIFLQSVRLEQVLQADFFPEHGHILDTTTMNLLCDKARAKGLTCSIR